MLRVFTWFLGSLLLLGAELGSLLLAGPAAPKRIASGTVGTDEILIELLSRRQELNRLIAVSIFSDNPQYSHLQSIPKSIKGRVGDSIEALLALNPDLALLASYNRQEISQQLRAAGIKVVVQEKFRSIADIQDNIRLIGSSVGIETDAEQLLKEMNADLSSAAAKPLCKGIKPSLLQYSEHDTVPGLKTILNDAAERSGFVNLAASLKLEGWTQISQEILATLQPDFIVVAGDSGQRAAIEKKLRQSVGWQKLKAVQSGQLIIVPERQLYSVSQHITKLVKTLAAARGC